MQDSDTTFSRFLHDLASPKTSLQDLRSQDITHSEQVYGLCVSIAPDTAHAWQASTHGCTVLSGTVHLADNAALLLSGTGVRFHGTVFQGAFRCPKLQLGLRVQIKQILFLRIIFRITAPGQSAYAGRR